MSSRPGGPGTKVVNDLSPEAVIKSIHIAQGLGATSAYTWLKLPAVDDMERVMDATTMPTLILGGDPVDDDPVALRASWKRALDRRSEEHTSELQSRGHLVCRLLLEKKNRRPP